MPPTDRPAPRPPVSGAAPASLDATRAVDGVRWAFLAGNFVIGCGVMSVVGTLNDLTRALGVSVAVGGQLVAVAAAVMCFGAPLLAGWVAGFDRRRLLTAALVWYGVGHGISALMPSYAALLPVRALTVLGAAVFTPQAAAAIGFMAPPQHRGQAITFIFLGWSLASVIGMPIAAWLGAAFGWQAAFVAIAVASLAVAGWVYAVVPDGVEPPSLSLRAWRSAFTDPLLMAIVAVTAFAAAGQFTLFSYFAPYFRDAIGADARQIGGLFVWFGAFGLVGNLLLSRWVDRIGADRAVTVALVGILVSLLLWPLGTGLVSLALVALPWALTCFASNSAQQARLGTIAPALAPALMALNTSAIYFGQAAGAASGGWFIAHGGYAPLPAAGAVWLVAAIGLSVWAGRRRRAGSR